MITSITPPQRIDIYDNVFLVSFAGDNCKRNAHRYLSFIIGISPDYSTPEQKIEIPSRLTVIHYDSEFNPTILTSITNK